MLWDLASEAVHLEDLQLIPDWMLSECGLISKIYLRRWKKDCFTGNDPELSGRYKMGKDGLNVVKGEVESRNSPITLP